MTDQTAAAPVEPISPERFAELAQTIEAEVGRFIVGQHQLVRQTLISLLAGSHALPRERYRQCALVSGA